MSVTGMQEQTFSFGDALEHLKRGNRVTRKGWNGKNQYIQLGSDISHFTANGKKAKIVIGAICNQTIVFVGTSGVRMGWLASSADILAEDWIFA